MKTKTNTLLGAVLTLLVTTALEIGALNVNAATQVYDLSADWSDTQNPNGPWSYRYWDGSLLPNDSIPWGYLYIGQGDLQVGYGDVLTKITGASVMPGYREAGDVFALSYSGVSARWTAPASGTINIAGGLWEGSPDSSELLTQWMLTHNGIALSGGNGLGGSDLSFGSAGANALLNVQVEAGDRVELAFLGYGTLGLNFTITLTSVDPVAAIEALATTVIEMNLQNGIENSLDNKLDAALNALGDANANNDAAACNSLAAFINAVEAQRGNKLTSAQADQLIASAQAIETMLSSEN